MCTAVLIDWDPATFPPLPPHLGSYCIRGRYWSAKIDDIALWPPVSDTLCSEPAGNWSTKKHLLDSAGISRQLTAWFGHAQCTLLYETSSCNPPPPPTLPSLPATVALIKKKIKFSSSTRKFRVEQSQSHIWGRANLMRKHFPIYEEAVSHIWLCNCSILNFLIYEENLIFFLSVC